MDVLSDVLIDMRVTAAMYCRFDVATGYGVTYPPRQSAGFHVVVEGAVALVVDGARHALGPGDFAVVAAGTPHRIEAGAGARCELVESVVIRATNGAASVGDGPAHGRYLCGSLHFGAAGDHPLIRALPQFILVRSSEQDARPWLRAMLGALCCEERAGRPGAGAVMSRLSEMLFVEAIRHHLAGSGDRTGWLGALRDPALGQAIGLLHRAPARAWTVDALAREVGLSRSQFAARFTTVLGVPPLAYLAEWRMHLARSMLREPGARVGDVARRVGYGSDAAFSVAFQRMAGMAPSAFRGGAESSVSSA